MNYLKFGNKVFLFINSWLYIRASTNEIGNKKTWKEIHGDLGLMTNFGPV